MGLLQPGWLPPCSMQHVVVHWTAGGPKFDDFDAEFYHFGIQDDGTVLRGTHAVSANTTANINAGGDYAAHVYMWNGGSIGVAFCAMGGDPPEAIPITQAQWDALPPVLAQLCRAYDIVPDMDHVLSHMEVSDRFVYQGGKWDVSYCPPAGVTSKDSAGALAVGDMFRARTAALLHPPAPASLVLHGQTIAGVLDNGVLLVPVRVVAVAGNWSLHVVDSGHVELAGKSVAMQNREGVGYVSVRDLAQALGLLRPAWDPILRKATLP